MITVKENKVLSVIIDDVYAVEYDTYRYRMVSVYYVGCETKDLVDDFEVEAEIKTVEELKEFAMKWHSRVVRKTTVVEPIREKPCIADLELYSQKASVVSIKDFDFISFDEIPTVLILNADRSEDVTSSVGGEIMDVSDLERFAIKWYYKNVAGIEF